MKIESVELRLLRVPLKAPFETSFGRFTSRDCILVAVSGGGEIGYAECTAMSTPYYNEETTGTAWHILEQFLIPRVLGREVELPEQIAEWFAPLRRNYMTIAALEGAIWDLHGKLGGVSLATALGGERRELDVGVSIGIEPTIDGVLRNVDRFLAEGYKKIKVKIRPGFDIRLMEAIRKQFGPDVPLMADANSAYGLGDIDALKELDSYNLLMIEQPLAHDDIIDHAKLQKQLKTPICLDESILTVDDVRKAIELDSCRIVNIKVGRVGGLTRARDIHDLCRKNGIPVWCGGMFELGLGRAHNMAIASLPNFTIAGDTSASSRHWEEDIVEPALEFVRPGTLAVPTGKGIGYNINMARVNKFTVRRELFDKSFGAVR